MRKGKQRKHQRERRQRKARQRWQDAVETPLRVALELADTWPSGLAYEAMRQGLIKAYMERKR